jgi:integrase
MPTAKTTAGPRPSFYLKRPDAESSAIYALLAHDGKKTKIYLNLSVETKRWDSKEQRARLRGFPQGAVLNAELDRVSATLSDFYLQERSQGRIPSDGDLRACIAPKQAEDRRLDFWSAWDLYCQKQAGSPTMTKKLASIRKRLEVFSKTRPLDLDTFGHAVMEDIQEFFTAAGLQASTTAKNLSFIKSFLHWCVKREITSNVKWQRFSVSAPPDGLKVALTKAELNALRNTPLPNSHLRNARDLFLISCLTGLRHSDYCRIKAEHVRDGLLTLRMEKTDSYVSVPLSEESERLIARLIAGEIHAISNQKLNRYLKELGQICGLTDPFEVNEFRGKMKVSRTVPKYELIGTHTGRRTFATSLLLSGLPAQTVMLFTGHKDLKSFSKYVNIPRTSQNELARAAIAMMA